MLAFLPTLLLSSAVPLTLEGSTLRLAGAGGSVLLEGMDRSLRASPSGTGGVFLHGDFREPMAAADVSLGTLHCGRLLSTARCTRYWMAPAVGDSAADVPLDSQMVLLEFAAAAPRVGAEAACYALMLPLVDREARSSLSAAGMSLPRFVRRLSRRLLPHLLPRCRLARGLSLHVESGDEAVRVPAGACLLYVAAGADPYELLARGVAEVAARLGTFAPRAAKSVPPSADVFGWCTWDGFYSCVAPEDVLAGAASLNEAGVPPRLIVLDDGWQTVTPPPPPAAAEPAPVRPALAEAAAAEEAAAAPVAVAPAAAGQVTAGQVAAGQAAAGQVAAAGPAPPPAAEASGVVERLAGRVSLQLRRAFAVLAAAASRGLQRWYERVVSRSRYGSLPVRVWTLLATRLLRSTMEEYYESETDFGRQLGAFAPNRKFEASASGEAAERAGGPKLARLVRELKQRHGVRYVYAWHALHGYWRGVAASLGAAEGLEVQQVFARPSTHLQRVEPQVRWDAMTLFGTGLLLSRPQLDAFFARLHAPLAAAGVDGVKVDVQSGLASLGGGVGGGPSLAARYVGALEASVATTFGPHLLHCMCHSTENLYRYTHGSLLRASDDFYPSRPASHTMHIVNVGYNSLLLGELGVPDWDMFTSLNEAASLHAAARAISGGPVYVSDAPGQHDVPLLRKLALLDAEVQQPRAPSAALRSLPAVLLVLIALVLTRRLNYTRSPHLSPPLLSPSLPISPTTRHETVLHARDVGVSFA